MFWPIEAQNNAPVSFKTTLLMQLNYEQGPLTNDGQDGSWLQDEKEAGHCFSSFKVPAHLLRDIINWLSRGFPLRISFMSFFCMLEF